MKLNKYIIPVVACTLMLGSCDDQKMEWGRPDGQGDVNISDIPLDLSEKLANYDYIKAYAAKYMPGATIGIGLGADLYIDDADYRQVADDNFQMITTGNAMKHASVLNNSGTFNFTTIDKFFDALPSGMKVYGHTLLWHTQQRASYLNALIAPDVIIEPDGGVENIIANSDFEEGNISGWGAWSSNGCTAEISAQGDGCNSDYAMKLTNPVAGESYSAQAYYTLPAMAWEVGETYVYSAYVYSEAANSNFQMQLQMRSGSYPGGAYQSESIPGGQWHLFEKEFEMTQELADLGITHLTINFGTVAGVVYIDNIQFGKKAAPDPMVNIFENSDFENGTTNPWSSWGNSSSRAISAEGEGYGSDYAMVLTNPSDADFYSAQAGYDLATPLLPGVTYIMQFWAKSDSPAGQLQTQYQNIPSYGNQGAYKTHDVGTSWTLCESEFSTTFDDVNRILINFGKVGGTYYIDNVKFGQKVEGTRSALTRGVITIEKSDEEKKQIITDAMETWISTMVNYCKDRINMWDVLNEPVSDDLRLRGVDFVPSTVGEQEFYWGQYMGKEYALKAFRFAREADPTAKLFINDYNLESNPNKLAALIDYAKWIDEQNGSPIVDGIGTQMHLIASAITREQIDAMFKTMAATGKMVRVTELDVRLESTEPATPVSATDAQFEQQAKVYQWVADSYRENIPAAQQSGITIWTLTDAAREHEYWLKNDLPNLFTKDYARKHAYKGFCDGIAGRDISEDFTGDDWKTGRENEGDE